LNVASTVRMKASGGCNSACVVAPRRKDDSWTVAAPDPRARQLAPTRILRGRKGKDGVGEIVLRDADTEMSGIARNFEPLQREKWRREAGMEGREEVERRMLRSRLLRGHQDHFSLCSALHPPSPCSRAIAPLGAIAGRLGSSAGQEGWEPQHTGGRDEL
jgi:hypothetical protein